MKGMDLETCAGLYSVVSLETAHSTTTRFTRTTAVAASTLTDISTVVVVISDTQTLVFTDSTSITSTSQHLATATSTISSANTTYIEYTPINRGHRMKSQGRLANMGTGIVLWIGLLI